MVGVATLDHFWAKQSDRESGEREKNAIPSLGPHRYPKVIMSRTKFFPHRSDSLPTITRLSERHHHPSGYANQKTWSHRHLPLLIYNIQPIIAFCFYLLNPSPALLLSLSSARIPPAPPTISTSCQTCQSDVILLPQGAQVPCDLPCLSPLLTPLTALFSAVQPHWPITASNLEWASLPPPPTVCTWIPYRVRVEMERELGPHIMLYLQLALNLQLLLSFNPVGILSFTIQRTLTELVCLLHSEFLELRILPYSFPYP